MPWSAAAVNIDPQADNRIHDDEVAASFGFRGALVPGVELFALASVPPVRAWAEDFLAAGALSLRFRSPVYDGEQITVTCEDGRLAVVGPDGTTRATGAVSRTAPASPPRAYEDVALPPRPAPAPRVGPFGTVRAPADPDGCAEYVRRIGDDSPVYARLVHPGLLLRLVNLALMRNVELGPWIHTASDCRFLSPAGVDEDLQVRSVVTERFERNGHSYVRYDALLLAGDRPVAEVQHEAIWRLAGQAEAPSTQA